MGGIKKKLQKLFGGGKKRARRDGNLSEFSSENQGLGGEGMTGLGMTQAGTDLGDWGNGAILDELKPPSVPSRRERPELTTARRDNPTMSFDGGGGGLVEESSEESSGTTLLSGDDESSLESSGETTVSESLESSGSGYSESSLESSDSGDDESSLLSPGSGYSWSSLFGEGGDLGGGGDLEGNDSREDNDSDDLSSLPTLGLVSQGSNIPEPPPLPPKYMQMARLGKAYQGEEVVANWREHKEGNGKTRTVHLSESEREQRRLGVDGEGRITKGGGLVTTGKEQTDGTRTGGEDLFAMSPEGDILSSNDVDEQKRLNTETFAKLDEVAREMGKGSWGDLTSEEKGEILESGRVLPEHFHHSSFFGGKDVGGVGGLRAKEGIIKKITPDSGHYKPGVTQSLNTVKELKERGANLDHARVGVHERDDDGDLIHDRPDDPRHARKKYFHPNEILESEGKEETLLGKKGFVDEIDRIGGKARGISKDDEVGEDLPDIDDLLYRARGKMPAPEREQKPKPEPGPEEFTGRSFFNPGSDPKGESKYTDTTELHGEYKGEHDFARWRSTDHNTPSTYDSRTRTAALTDEGRDKRRLHVGEDGMLYNSEGLLLDTIDSGGLIRDDMDEGAFIFAMDETGDILTSDAYEENIQLQKRKELSTTREGYDKQFFHHSSFFGGRDVAGAGGLRARDGKAVTLTPNSGHYHSGNKQTLNVFEELLDRGVDISDLKIDMLTKKVAEPEERQLGGHRMQYLAAGAVREAMGTEDDQGVTRDKTLARLEQQVGLLDEIKRVRYLASTDESTQALEDEMVGYMRDGAFESEIVKQVEDRGDFEVLEIDVARCMIKIIHAQTPPSRIREVSDPKKRAQFESQQAKREGDQKKERQEHYEQEDKGTWSRDVDRLPEWARPKERKEQFAKMKANDAEERAEREKDRLKAEKKARKKREREEAKKKQGKKPYGSSYSFVRDHVDETVSTNESNVTSEPNTDVEEEEVNAYGGTTLLDWDKPETVVTKQVVEDEPQEEIVDTNNYGSYNSQTFLQKDEPKQVEPPVEQTTPKRPLFSWEKPKQVVKEEPEEIVDNNNYGSYNSQTFLRKDEPKQVVKEEPEEEIVDTNNYGSYNSQTFLQKDEPKQVVQEEREDEIDISNYGSYNSQTFLAKPKQVEPPVEQTTPKRPLFSWEKPKPVVHEEDDEVDINNYGAYNLTSLGDKDDDKKRS